MTRRFFFMQTLVTAFALALIGCSGSSGSDDDDSTGTSPVDASTASKLSVANSRGTVTVTGVTGSTRVEVTPTFGGGAQADYDQVTIKAALNGSTVEIAASVPESLPDVTVDLAINAPAGLAYDVTTGAGAMTLKDLTGAGKVTSGAGSISGTGLVGGLQVQTDSGAIDLHAALSSGGEIDITSGAGSIKLGIPASTSADVSAVAQNGTVTFSNLAFSGVNFNGTASGSIGSGSGGTLNLTTGSGNITVTGE